MNYGGPVCQPNVASCLIAYILYIFISRINFSLSTEQSIFIWNWQIMMGVRLENTIRWLDTFHWNTKYSSPTSIQTQMKFFCVYFFIFSFIFQRSSCLFCVDSIQFRMSLLCRCLLSVCILMVFYKAIYKYDFSMY